MTSQFLAAGNPRAICPTATCAAAHLSTDRLPRCGRAVPRPRRQCDPTQPVRPDAPQFGVAQPCSTRCRSSHSASATTTLPATPTTAVESPEPTATTPPPFVATTDDERAIVSVFTRWADSATDAELNTVAEDPDAVRARRATKAWDQHPTDLALYDGRARVDPHDRLRPRRSRLLDRVRGTGCRTGDGPEARCASTASGRCPPKPCAGCSPWAGSRAGRRESDARAASDVDDQGDDGQDDEDEDQNSHVAVVPPSRAA